MLGRAIDLLLPLPLYLLAVLGWLSTRSWRRAPPDRPPRLHLHRVRHLLVALTAWVWLVSMPATGHGLYRLLEGRLERPAERPVARDPDSLVVVLASGQMHDGDGTIHPRLDVHGWERTVEGIALWKRTGGTLVFCGGPGRTHETSLAGAMRRVALDMGVPDEAIRTATGSANTREDLQQAQALLALLPRQDGPVWLVTSALHMPRSLAVARRLGLQVRPFSVDYRQIHGFTWRAWLPHNAAPARVAAALHEIVGRLAYRLKGWSD